MLLHLGECMQHLFTLLIVVNIARPAAAYGGGYQGAMAERAERMTATTIPGKEKR